ncbi:MAG: biopolymer transporter ExbD [Methylacidiphilales bacterium]|nr:biopolymer transporter ExbD [Candidatus Methylacidiphilales bacterium]MDW8349849.1 biopolymer transporter ExbD [Verrucomicrobiae bacterium]
MKRFSSRSGYTSMAELNVTPMIDLAFTLLIIFIITTPLLEQTIPLQLPVATIQPDSQPAPEAPPKTIHLDLQGIIYAENRPVTPSQLEDILIEWKNSDPQVAVVLRADKDTRYQQIVDILDALKNANIKRFGLVHTQK